MATHASIGIATFQDFEAAPDKGAFVLNAIEEHRCTHAYRTAQAADLYDRQMNETINTYVKRIFNMAGSPIEDFTASNNKIASNFFNRLNTQRCTYSLGNGVDFTDVSGTDPRELLGDTFDHDMQEMGYHALIHGVAFGFWNVDRLHCFRLNEFLPIWDEEDGSLRAGARFWRLDCTRPLHVVLYEEDGYTKYVSDGSGDTQLKVVQDKRKYITKYATVPAVGIPEVIGEDNYGKLPIVPLWGSRLRQSTLVGMRSAIDSYDLIQSGFANDLTDVSMIYWVISNCGGMTDEDLARFRDRLKLQHIAAVGDDEDAKVTPYTQEVPSQSRDLYLQRIEDRIYNDFGGLNVTSMAAGEKTATEIEAAYQPLDENASDFEYQVTEFLIQILDLVGTSGRPQFCRQRVTNQLEAVQVVVAEAQWLDRETILHKLPNISPDEVDEIMARADEEDAGRFGTAGQDPAVSVPDNPVEPTAPEGV